MGAPAGDPPGPPERRTKPLARNAILAGLVAGAVVALLLYRPGDGVRRIRTFGSPDAPRAAGEALDFGEMTLAVVGGTAETPLPTRGAEPLVAVPFALRLVSRAERSFPLTHLSARLLDGAGGVVPAAPDRPGAFLDTGETRLVGMGARVPAGWKARLVHVEWVGPGGRAEAFVRLR